MKIAKVTRPVVNPVLPRMERLFDRLFAMPYGLDMPDLEVVMMSVANGHTNTGAVGLGEPPSVAAPAAVANAVYHALGVPVRHLPITPDKVLLALGQRKGG